MSTEPTAEERITQARDRLAAKLAELQHRVTHAKAIMSPRTYLDNPWVRLGAAAAVGYLIGRTPASRRLMPGEAVVAPAEPPGFIAATLRTALIGLASAVVRRAITEVLRSVDKPGAGAGAVDQKPTTP